MTQNTKRELWKIVILVLIAVVLLGVVAPGDVESPYNEF
jgi:hypothetical protein